ncbi:MAG: lysophospholipid acyltransferase family protein [Anaerolineae bacterium]
MKLARAILAVVLRLAMRLLLRLEVEGLERIPARGPVILIFNHITFLDPVILTGLLPRESAAMSKVENFSKPVVGLLLRIFGAFPVERGRVDRRALRRSLEVLERGGVLLIAPEGTRSRVPGLQEGKDGIAYVALQSGVSVIPVGIAGAERFSANLRNLRRTPVRVRVGRPFRLVPKGPKVRRPELHEMTTEAMYELAKVLPPAYRGVYADLSQARQEHLEFLDVAPGEEGHGHARG